MDEFGVLVESIGFKAQGKSAPIADLKGKSRNFGINSSSTSVNRPKSVYNSNSVNGSFDGGFDGVFQSGNYRKSQSSADFDGFDDVFGGPIKNSKPPGGVDFDLDSMFKSSNSFSVNSSLYNDDDIFGPVASFPKQSAPVEDLFGNFVGMGLESGGTRKSTSKVEKNAREFDGLIPGFSGSSLSGNGQNSETIWSPVSSGHSAKSTSTSAEDPFVVLEQSSSQAAKSTSSSAEDPFAVFEQSSSQAHTSSWFFSEPVEQDAGKSSVFSSFDELDGFATVKVQNKANEQSKFSQKERAESATHDLDSFFSSSAKPSNSSRHQSTMVDPVYDSLFQSRGNSEVKQTPSGTSSVTKKVSPSTNLVNDFSFIFGEIAPSSGVFQEIEGESEERRKARLNHHIRTQQRMAKALAEKNQRDFQTQQEQEERHRISETLDDDIKRWAAGKEGNLRALLSSLQNVLWTECGWQPVSLTDLITSGSVKKVYFKATLCVHPDKVQQKGANIEQKYTAEKVFDLLKEAWNKFNAEEL